MSNAEIRTGIVSLAIIIGYLLIGRLVGCSARLAWIQAQKRRVYGRHDITLWGKLPAMFHVHFPYTAVTRRLRLCPAQFLVAEQDLHDADSSRAHGRSEHDPIDGDDLTYVRAHMLLWPLRVAFNVCSGTAALFVAYRRAQGPERQIERLQKKRERLFRDMHRLKDRLDDIDQELEPLIKRRTSDLAALAKAVKMDKDSALKDTDRTVN